TIDVVSDVICPWCFLGKRRLDKALKGLPGIDAAVIWRPFYLDPTIPEDGMDRRTYLANKFGEERLPTLHDPLIEAGKKDGVPYHFERVTRTPNTRKAHILLQYAAGSPRQHELAERLFMAYWNEGRDIGSEDALLSIAKEKGFEEGEVRSALSDSSRAIVVDREVQQAQRMGITGVPTFIIGRRLALVGAQPAEAIADAIAQAMQPVSPTSS
ncbi:MAG: DsbA family oxidoreductase, partial [Rhizobiales bacterium]|nr:DsbA family oxidoreductase [Hyphomicrobiales bacterium]